MKIWLTKACSRSLYTRGLEQVSIWFRKPVFHPEGKCIFTDATIWGTWGTDGPGPAHLSGYHFHDTNVGSDVWDIVLESQKELGTISTWRSQEIPEDSPNHYKKWIYEVEVNFDLTKP